MFIRGQDGRKHHVFVLVFFIWQLGSLLESFDSIQLNADVMSSSRSFLFYFQFTLLIDILYQFWHIFISVVISSILLWMSFFF